MSCRSSQRRTSGPSSVSALQTDSRAMRMAAASWSKDAAMLCIWVWASAQLKNRIRLIHWPSSSIHIVNLTHYDCFKEKVQRCFQKEPFINKSSSFGHFKSFKVYKQHISLCQRTNLLFTLWRCIDSNKRLILKVESFDIFTSCHGNWTWLKIYDVRRLCPNPDSRRCL